MKRRYELTNIPSLDSVPETGDLIVENGPGTPGLLPIHMLMTAIVGPVSTQLDQLESRVEILESGSAPPPPSPPPAPPAITPPTITTNGGNDLTVTINQGVETVSQLSAIGTFPIVWDRSGPNAALFFVDSQTWEVSFRNPPGPGSYSVTLTARNGGSTTASITLTVHVAATTLVAPSIAGDSSIGTSLTPVPGGYTPEMLFWLRDGEVVQVGRRSYGKSPVDANKQIVLAAMSGGAIIAQSAPILVVSNGVPASDQYEKVFSDNFTSDISRFTDSGLPQIGKQVWRTRYSWDRDTTINYEWQRHTAPEDVGNGSTPRGIQMLSLAEGGGLEQNVRRATAEEIPLFSWSNDSHYAAAAAYGSDRNVEKWLAPVASQQHGYNCQYSYNELEVSAPQGRAMWFAAWFLSSELTWPPEFDFPETDGARNDKAYFSTHKLDANGNKVSIGSGWMQMPDTIDKRIRIGLEWSPTRAAYYVDGVEVWSVSNHDIHHRMFWVLNMAVGSGTYDGTWIMPPDASSPSPTKATVHAVRTYQRPSYRSLPPSLVSRPILYIQGNTATIIPGRSNATAINGYLRSGTVKLSGTDNVTTFDISSIRPTAPGTGINLNYGETHVMVDDTTGAPRRRFVNSQIYWVTPSTQGYLQEPSHDWKALTKIEGLGQFGVWRPDGYTGPWAYLPNEFAIGSWNRGNQFRNEFWHDTSAAFPSGSRLEWQYPPTSSSVSNFCYGYASFMYGAGPWGYPYQSSQHPTPTRAGDFDRFTIAYDLTIGGNVVPNDILIDIYTVPNPNNLDGTHVNEISFFPHMLQPDHHEVTHDFGGDIGVCSIYKQPTSEQIMIRPVTAGKPRSVLKATLNVKALIDELITRGLVDPTAYVVGFEIGNEPQQPNWWNDVPCEGWYRLNSVPVVNWVQKVQTELPSNDYPTPSGTPAWASLAGDTLNRISPITWTSDTTITDSGSRVMVDGEPLYVAAQLVPNVISTAAGWVQNGATLSAADSNGWVTIAKPSSTDGQLVYAPVSPVTNYTQAMIEIRAGSVATAHIGLWGANAWSDGTTTCYAKVVRGPGSITKFSGALFTVAGLSATESTYLHIVRKTANTDSVRIYPGAFNSTTSGASIKVRRLSVKTIDMDVTYGREVYFNTLGQIDAIYLSAAETTTAVYEQHATNAVGTRRIRSNGTRQDTPDAAESDFKFISALNYENQPDLSPYGLETAVVVYEQELYPGVPRADRGWPIPAGGLANFDARVAAAAANAIICVDIEYENPALMMYPWTKGDTFKAMVQVFRDIAILLKSRMKPGQKLGFYGYFPTDNPLPNAGVAEHVHPRAEMVQHNTWMAPVIEVVDFLAPCTYLSGTYSGTLKPGDAGVVNGELDSRVVTVINSIASEAQRIAPDKPCYLFVSPETQNTQTQLYPDLTYTAFKFQLDACRAAGLEGVFLWGGYDISVPPRESDGNIQLKWPGASAPFMQAISDVKEAA